MYGCQTISLVCLSSDFQFRFFCRLLLTLVTFILQDSPKEGAIVPMWCAICSRGSNFGEGICYIQSGSYLK